MRRYTQLEMEILKAAGFTTKEIAKMDKTSATGYINIWSGEDIEYYDSIGDPLPTEGEEIEYLGKKYLIQWVL